jgi:RNA 2',3'-cyclic 3'-phosphodiesterase
VRLFFALLPDASTLGRLSNVAAHLQIAGRARLVPPKNFHITLAFVGEVPDGDVQILREMGDALGLQRCAIELNKLEYWPNSQAIVLTARAAPRDLATRTEQLRAAAAAKIRAGRDKMKWHAHVTLARKVAQAPVFAVMSPITWVSHSVGLVTSDTGGRESSYTVVDSWPLLDET